MYQWHVYSAIGRSRPLVGDLSRAADGIAASLRLFSVSVARVAEDGGAAEVPRPSRAQRSAAAAAEISSLSPGGIDARSLAAKPPPTFTIRRVHDSPTSAPRFQNQGFGIRNTRGGQSAGGATRGNVQRGGRRGGLRGGMRGRGRGAIKRNKRKGSNESLGANLMNGEPLTVEEQAYVDGVEMGVAAPATVGITTWESLEREAPAIAASNAPVGAAETINSHMRSLVGHHGNENLSSEQHSLYYGEGKGTFFVDERDKARATGSERHVGAPEEYNTLNEGERQAILQTLVKGQYQPIKQIVKGDTLVAIDAYTQKNETYLPKDAAVLKARVERLLPSQAPAKPSTSATPRRQAIVH